MTKIRLFYSYSHKDEKFRDELEVHLATLRNNGLIDEWHDRKIDAGDDWDEEIELNMENSHIILLLFSPDFIASNACLKEVKAAMNLKKSKGTVFIPIILRKCAWKNVDGIAKIQGLPTDGVPVKTWRDQDEAWSNVYSGVKAKVDKLIKAIKPSVRDEFMMELSRNPIENGKLDELFVFPDILRADSGINKKLENNEIDSKKLLNLDSLGERYVVLEGEEQSGKTSLCNILYSNYIDAGLYPILLNGIDIYGKAELADLVEKYFLQQYDSTSEYINIDKNKRVLLIDDVDKCNANTDNYSNFVSTIQDFFGYAVIFIDELANLSDRSTEHEYFSQFQNYTIQNLGHKKRDELLKKCIAYDEQMDFDSGSNDHLARLDKNTKHINAIIGANVVPSKPVFIVTIFHTVESATYQDLSKTSYGHCYQAMITMNLARANIKAEDISASFNFLTELAYFMFDNNSKGLSEEELSTFTATYERNFNIQEKIVESLIKANILVIKNDLYRFRYVYIYYYFVAKFISQKMNEERIKIQLNELMENIHMKDNANIIIFITHHTNSQTLLDDITLSAMSTFDNFSEATLAGDEKNFIKVLSDSLKSKKLPGSTHDVKNERDKKLCRKDGLAELEQKIENDESSNPLMIEIRKSAKSMEIIGQILKNQYGVLEKSKLEELFEEGQNVGLRLLNSFIKLMISDGDSIESIIQSRLDYIAKSKGKELTESEKEKASQKILAQFSYGVVYGWLHKIVDSLGYDKLIGIADNVNNKKGTVASKLINLSIHTWYAKKLKLSNLKLLYREFENDKNFQAIYLLKDIVSRHIYMHPIDYKDKQKIDDLLGFSVQNQVSIQKKLENKFPQK